MHRILPLFIWAVCSSSIIPLAFALPLIAHQEQAGSNIEAMIHLDPHDSPYAGRPTPTWFLLTRRDGSMISPAVCNCRVAVYDTHNQSIAKLLPLSSTPLEGHQNGHASPSTMILFPKAGAYTVVLSGQAKDKSFPPFKAKFSAVVRP